MASFEVLIADDAGDGQLCLPWFVLCPKRGQIGLHGIGLGGIHRTSGVTATRGLLACHRRIGSATIPGRRTADGTGSVKHIIPTVFSCDLPRLIYKLPVWWSVFLTFRTAVPVNVESPNLYYATIWSRFLLKCLNIMLMCVYVVWCVYTGLCDAPSAVERWVVVSSEYPSRSRFQTQQPTSSLTGMKREQSQ